LEVHDASALAEHVVEQAMSAATSGVSAEEVKQVDNTHVTEAVGDAAGLLEVDAALQQIGSSADFDTADVQAKLDQFVQPAHIDLPSEVPADFANAADAQAQEQELANASDEEVIAALLALLNSTELQAMAAIDAAETAVLSIIDNARTQAIAGFAQVDMPELKAFVLAQLDMARTLVQQAFDQIRAKVAAAFAEARNRIVEELTGVDFGDALDQVLAQIAAIQNMVQTKLAEVQQLLQNLPVPVIG
jgi:hypothetical protein